jgi:hypothetical protein
VPDNPELAGHSLLSACVAPLTTGAEGDRFIRDVRHKLSEIIQQHGPAVADDERRLDELLTDVLGPRSNNEVLLLVSAAMAGVVDELCAGGKTSASDADVMRLAMRMQKEFGVNAPTAKWAVESWAAGLGMRSNDSPVTTSASVDAKPSELPSAEEPSAVDSPQQRLQRAIKQAMADGVISPEEKAKLRELALDVKQRVQAAKDSERAAKRKKLLLTIAVASVAVFLIVGAVSWVVSSAQQAAERRRESDAVNLFASEQREWVARAEQLRDRATRDAATIEDFANRLERAARQASDQQRTEFRMGGQVYTQAGAKKTIEAARAYVADQRSRATTAQAFIDRVRPLLDAFARDPSKSETLQPLRTLPTTLPAEMPAFDPAATK